MKWKMKFMFETTNQALMRGMHPYTHVTIYPHLTHSTRNRHSTKKHVNDMDLKMIQHDLYAPCIVYLPTKLGDLWCNFSTMEHMGDD